MPSRRVLYKIDKIGPICPVFCNIPMFKPIYIVFFGSSFKNQIGLCIAYIIFN